MFGICSDICMQKGDYRKFYDISNKKELGTGMTGAVFKVYPLLFKASLVETCTTCKRVPSIDNE